MSQQDLSNQSEIGFGSGMGTDDCWNALSLLGAAPFLILERDDLIWPQPKLAKHLLRSKSNRLPSRTVDWEGVIDDEGRHLRAQALRNLTWDGAQYAVKYQITTQDEHLVWVEERGERYAGHGKTPTHIRGVIVNVHAAELSMKRAAYLTYQDELTGVWNQTRFTEALEQAIAIAKRGKISAVLLRIKLSNLTDINTVNGYDTGDFLLSAAADRLQDTVNMPDMLARILGGTFGIILYESENVDFETTIDNIKEVLSVPYATPHGNLNLEYDMSATVLGDDAHTPFEAFSQTRLALDKSNTSSVSKYLPEMGALRVEPNKMMITQDSILEALNDRQISLAYQPIIDAKTRDLHHYECLLRLRSPTGEVISAGQFIMGAEKLGLVDLLDRRALELASETLMRMPDVHLALNVSAGTIKNKDTADAYVAALKALGPAVKRVTLELTETVALEDPAMACRFSDETRTLGCQFAIDDFGAGYTTFRNLMAVEADAIKIDGSFIQNLSRNSSNQTFVRMMVDLAQTFNVKTVAEMVDNHADANLLKRLGVDYLQGYMFGIPSASPAWRREAS